MFVEHAILEHLLGRELGISRNIGREGRSGKHRSAKQGCGECHRADDLIVFHLRAISLKVVS